jgi:hypothetical protein
MRPKHEWDEEFIFNLPIGEFDWFEVKGRRGLDLTLSNVNERDVLHNLSRALSAFANSGGGALIYGLKNPTVGATGWAVDDGGVDTTYKNDTREWLGNVIPPLVDHELRGFNVYSITPTGPASQIQAGRALYLIDIPDSPNAPHQANDKRYYIRAGGKSVPIGHRLVMDIMGRRQHPQISLDFRIAKTPHVSTVTRQTGEVTTTNHVYLLTVTARNTGRVYAQYVNAFVQVPAGLHRRIYGKHPLGEGGPEPFYEYRIRNTTHDPVTELSQRETVEQTRVLQFNPILPGLTYTWELTLDTELNLSSCEQQKVRWTVHADNAPPNTGEVLVTDIPIVDESAA